MLRLRMCHVCLHCRALELSITLAWRCEPLMGFFLRNAVGLQLQRPWRTEPTRGSGSSASWCAITCLLVACAYRDWRAQISLSSFLFGYAMSCLNPCFKDKDKATVRWQRQPVPPISL